MLRTRAAFSYLFSARNSRTAANVAGVRALSSSASDPSPQVGAAFYPSENVGERGGERFLVTGCMGQIGQDLVTLLRRIHGVDSVVATDVRHSREFMETGPFETCDVTDMDTLQRLCIGYNVTCVVHLATILSAMAEQNPQLAIRVNQTGIHNVMEVARQQNLRVYAPSTIAVFGPTTPLECTPDTTVMEPTTIYGVSKVYMELLGSYYKRKYDLDFRSLRYPGIISSDTLPGGGTTDYAVEIYYKALTDGKYTSFIDRDIRMPMMYMPDCLQGTIDFMNAPRDSLKRTVYNIGAMSFSPEEIAESIKKYLPNFEMRYEPDFRNEIAKSWPRALDDRNARNDWGWSPEYDLDKMTKDMLEKLSKRLNISM